jgi:hypothetical protein
MSSPSRRRVTSRFGRADADLEDYLQRMMARLILISLDE